MKIGQFSWNVFTLVPSVVEASKGDTESQTLDVAGEVTVVSSQVESVALSQVEDL